MIERAGDLVVFSHGKKLARNAKGGPARRTSEALFADEIARLYSRSAFGS
jgi:hypothetical protein